MAEAYTGRFAPSPTGPLHLGSLASALASFLDARAHQGRWLLRIEDIDPPREVPGAAASIARQLDAHGLHWDGEILYQSGRATRYRDALQRLAARGLLFLCDCTRERLRRLDGNYDGACRDRVLIDPDREHPGYSIRVRTDDAPAVHFSDWLRGRSTVTHLERTGGDFVVRRRDGLFAYQLATAVDDAAQGITHVVRGNDLLESTPRQIFLLRALGLPVPAYGHVPVMTDSIGRKLSKQNHAPALDAAHARGNVYRALIWLGQKPPSAAAHASVAELLRWASQHWSPRAVWHERPQNITE
ncbi:MAG: tRNA glutamyl-Q(34) synthetase GluQRS [Porticoccaceae bacterium]